MNFPSAELIVDNFAGGGGASTGLERAFGRSPDVAINHDPEAIEMHKANHPTTEHFCKSIYQVDPDDIIRKYKRRIGFAWFSPDCTHHSKARGGKPKEKHIRDLAWVVVHWAERAVYKNERIRVIAVENVEEFKDWGPLLENGTPCPIQKGFEFKRWVQALRKLGYKVEWRELRACDYGAPTIRKRLVVLARCDGQPITWPEQTHGIGRSLAYRTAAECIDWSILCPSIFERQRPLAENTLRRIARGIQKFVIDSGNPFIVNITHTGSERVESLTEPMRIITSAHRGEKALVTPLLVGAGGPARAGEPKSCAKPLGTVMKRNHTHLVNVFLAQHNGQRYGFNSGRALTNPISTITQEGSQQQLVASHLIKLKGTCKDGQPVTDPLATVQAQGLHYGEVRAFLLKYYGNESDGVELKKPMHTVTSKDRFGLVTVHDENYIIADIGMRMLAPRELYRAQGFTDNYKIDPLYKGKPLTKTAQVRMCGNSVCPPMAQAVAMAQFLPPAIKEKIA